MRQVVLDTETTGLEISAGHRIIEIGCVEIIDRKLTRRTFHKYVNPGRDIEDGALEVHGITREFLADKAIFSQIWEDLFEFIKGAELVIHNAAFDLAFINVEMSLMSKSLGCIEDYCGIVDSLDIARQKHPGQKNNLNALCKRYGVDNTRRDLHGALLDAEILADVYLLMTGGQVALSLGVETGDGLVHMPDSIRRLPATRSRLKVIKATHDELERHERKLDLIDKSSGGSVWRKIVNWGS